MDKKAKCMRCGRIHKYYRFKRGQLMYLLWCENCGTAMHEPVSRPTTLAHDGGTDAAKSDNPVSDSDLDKSAGSHHRV